MGESHSEKVRKSKAQTPETIPHRDQHISIQRKEYLLSRTLSGGTGINHDGSRDRCDPGKEQN